MSVDAQPADDRLMLASVCATFPLPLQGELSDTQVHTQKSVEKMTVLHQIKQKLDVCTETIAQVAYLQSNVLKMSVVFADGNTGQIGSEISQMQVDPGMQGALSLLLQGRS